MQKMNYQQNYDPYRIPSLLNTFGGSGTQLGGPPEAPDYSYASAAMGYGANPLQATNFNSAAGVPPPYEYGSGQMGNNAAPVPYYDGSAPDQPPTSLIPSHTSSKDPNALKSRVFVGNLNTALVSRDQVYQIFCPFGQIVGISMHKGFAFVQFAFENEARNAVTFTDGTLLGGRKIDVTISSEPKSQPSSGDSFVAGNKRPADVSQSSLGQPGRKALRANPTPLSKPAISFAAFKKAGAAATPGKKPASVSAAAATNGTGVGAALKKDVLARGDDILICGRCRQLFSNTALFTGHKPKCTAPAVLVKEQEPEAEKKPKDDAAATAVDDPKTLARKGKPDGEPDKIQCFICHMAFDYSWYLLQHMSQSHSMTVYEPMPTGE